MSKEVYVLLISVPYEGDTFVGVFDSYKEMNEYKESNKLYSDAEWKEKTTIINNPND